MSRGGNYKPVWIYLETLRWSPSHSLVLTNATVWGTVGDICPTLSGSVSLVDWEYESAVHFFLFVHVFGSEEHF